MPRYQFVCDNCEALSEESFRIDDRPDSIPCKGCGEAAPRVILGTGLVIKEAYLDGTRRAGFAEMREASKLNREASTHRHGSEDRKRIERQIRQLTGGSLRRE